MSSIGKTHFVAYLDILGFKELVKKDNDGCWNLLVKFRERVIDRFNDGPGFLPGGKIEMVDNRCHSLLFSDTLLLFTYSDSWEDSWILLYLVSCFLAVSFENGIPVRGAITHGKFNFNVDKSLYAGEALVDAYELAEKSNWLGIGVSDGFAAQFLQRHPNPEIPFLTKWMLPIKEDKKESSEESHVLDWIAPFGMKYVRLYTPESFYKSYEKNFGHFADVLPDVQKKYVNTTEFINDRVRKLSERWGLNRITMRLLGLTGLGTRT